MWWKWVVLVLCGMLILACVIDTTVNWVKGKTGPLGPNPWDWWGCGVFTLILLGVAYWVGKGMFLK